jgi:LysW-gamma-L-lysine carboxypeptidase
LVTKTKAGHLPVDVSPEDWYGKLVELTGDSDSGNDRHLTVARTGFAVPAWECEKNTPLVRAFLSGIRSDGGEPRFVYKTGTADLNIVAPVWKCPAVVYGPGVSTMDHTPNEHLALEDYAKSVQTLHHALGNLVGKN